MSQLVVHAIRKPALYVQARPPADCRMYDAKSDGQTQPCQQHSWNHAIGWMAVVVAVALQFITRFLSGRFCT